MRVSGKVIEVLPSKIIKGSKGTWTKHVFILEVSGKPPKKWHWHIEYWKDDIEFLEGMVLEIGYTIDSKKYLDKWYTEITAQNIFIIGSIYHGENPNSIKIQKPEQNLPFNDEK